MELIDLSRTSLVVLLDRVADMPHPTYTTYALTYCVLCCESCWLGVASLAQLRAGHSAPLCLPCAQRYARREDLVGHVNDHATDIASEAARLRKEHLVAEGKAIQCPRCQQISVHPQDIRDGYCGHCHARTSPPRTTG